tara:strand:- start:925 stop:1110 length:186 start_codon:yes stop_codon:yes gene_type:complete
MDKKTKQPNRENEYWGEPDQDGNRGIRREMRKSKRKRDKQIVRDMLHDPNNEDYDIEEGEW